MEKVYYLDSRTGGSLWDDVWAAKSISAELAACEIESAPRQLFLSLIPAAASVVEAGCGFGKWVIYLKQRGYDIVGIDNNEIAIARLRQFDDTLKVEYGDILHMSYPDSYFDAYISMGVMEHFEDGPSRPLAEAYRVLKPNGLVFVSTPTLNMLRRIVRRPMRRAINAVPQSLHALMSGWGLSKRHAIRGAVGALLPESLEARLLDKRRRFQEYRYTSLELQAFLRQSGFEILTTVPHDFHGSKDHAIGLVEDFPFLGAQKWVNYELNPVGKIANRLLAAMSPWIACSSVLCVGRALPRPPAK